MVPHLDLRTRRSGFTLVELLIFSSIFVFVAVAFTVVLVSVARIQVRQSGAAEVNQQSQLLLQTIQYWVEKAAYIEMTADTETSTLKIRTDSASDPLYIYSSGTTVYIKETDAGTPQPLTSSKVQVTDLRFIKRSHLPAKDSVAVNFTLQYGATGGFQNFISNLDTSIARVSAATFDSSLNASPTAALYLGTSAGEWKGINNTIFFSGGNIGIGTAAPVKKFQINNDDLYFDTTNKGIIFNVSGVCYRLYLTTGGAIATTSVSCT